MFTVQLCVCVLLCFVDPILGKSRSRCHSLNQGTWGGRILTLHLNYVAGYTGPLLFLFERTHNYSVDNQGLVLWRLRRLGRSKVLSDSSVRCVPGSNWQTRGMTITHRMAGRRDRTDDLRNNSPSLDRWAQLADIRSRSLVTTVAGRVFVKKNLFWNINKTSGNLFFEK